MPRDSRHGKWIPEGHGLRRLIEFWLKFFRAQALLAISQGKVWIPTEADMRRMAVAAKPFLSATYSQGYEGQLMEFRNRKPIARLSVFRLMNGKSASLLRKDSSTVQTAVGNIDAAFNVFNPEVIDMLERMSMSFVESTLATVVKEVADAYQDLYQIPGLEAPAGEGSEYLATRRTLAEGLFRGETQQQLTRRVGEVFDDPDRAFRIATTESSRAMHGGQIDAAESVGVLSKEWLCSSDACERCLKLDGMVVPIDAPFAINAGTNPTYSTVYGPTLHPHCMCSLQFGDYDEDPSAWAKKPVDMSR